MKREEDVVTLMKFDSAGEANLYKGLLEANGIDCALEGETLGYVLPIGAGVFRIELVVAASDRERAEQIIAAGFDKEDMKNYKIDINDEKN